MESNVWVQERPVCRALFPRGRTDGSLEPYPSNSEWEGYGRIRRAREISRRYRNIARRRKAERKAFSSNPRTRAANSHLARIASSDGLRSRERSRRNGTLRKPAARATRIDLRDADLSTHTRSSRPDFRSRSIFIH